MVVYKFLLLNLCFDSVFCVDYSRPSKYMENSWYIYIYIYRERERERERERWGGALLLFT